jgi:glycosyltransferase involved in cell wall biosynthesis
VEKIGQVTVYRVGFGSAYLSKILFVPLAALKAGSLNKELRFAGMWAMMTYMLLPLTVARFFGVKVPYVLTLQDGDPYDKVFERWFIKPALPLIDAGFRHAQVIQVISEYLGTWPAKRGYKGEVVMVRNGANPKNFEQFYSDNELQKVRTDLGKKDNELYLFIAARLEYQKGIDAVIRAMPLLPETVKFLIAGSGSQEGMLKALASELKVSDRVIFLGSINRDDVPKYRNTIVSDAFVHPSRSEGLGNSVLSAMAGRLPVIASQVGGLADFIFDERSDKPATAWAVEPDAPEQIAVAVRDIMAHPEKVTERTQNARTMVEREYQWDQIAKDMKEKVFSSLR